MIKPIMVSDKMWEDFTSQFDSSEIVTLMEEVCEAVKSADLSESVMVILEKSKDFTVFKEQKCDIKSTEFRNKGNKAYSAKKFQEALVYYNRALLYASFKSTAMKLAYSNRSAVFLTVNCFRACFKDIDTCLAMGCPDDILEKLMKRKEQVTELFLKERLAYIMRQNDFTKHFFNDFNKNPNRLIPCCSASVKAVIVNDSPKIIASRNIRAGTVLAVETNFISETEFDNIYFSCYYCQKMELNLKPCKGCTYALFCDATCEKLALEEYHGIECAMGELDISKAYDKMMFKAALKIKNKCNSWKEFIEATYTMGNSRIKKSSVNEKYDVNNKFSMLNFKDSGHFVYGPRCSYSVLITMIIHHLKKVQYFPTNELEQPAIQAFARVLMYLYLYVPKTQKLPSVSNPSDASTMLHRNTNFGVYSFISKIKNACPGNCITIDLNRKQALVAMYPIPAGTELTIPFYDPWIDMSPLEMFNLYNTVSDCKICTKEKSPQQINFSKVQEDALLGIGIIGIQTNDEFNFSNVEKIYSIACNNMPLFANVPIHSDEHRLVYGLFRKCLLVMQDIESENIVLDLVAQ